MDRDDALRDLQYHWGSAYEIGYGIELTDGEIWHAIRRDTGAALTADAPQHLRRMILRDYGNNPVSRDTPEQEKAGREGV
jgi:hypothetical protein